MAIESAIDFLRDRLAVSLATDDFSACTYTRRNAQCPGETCPFY